MTGYNLQFAGHGNQRSVAYGRKFVGHRCHPTLIAIGAQAVVIVACGCRKSSIIECLIFELILVNHIASPLFLTVMPLSL